MSCSIMGIQHEACGLIIVDSKPHNNKITVLKLTPHFYLFSHCIFIITEFYPDVTQEIS